MRTKVHGLDPKTNEGKIGRNVDPAQRSSNRRIVGALSYAFNLAYELRLRFPLLTVEQLVDDLPRHGVYLSPRCKAEVSEFLKQGGNHA